MFIWMFKIKELGLAHKWRKVTWTDETSVAEADGKKGEKEADKVPDKLIGPGGCSTPVLPVLVQQRYVPKE